jgi:two-component system sensor histidine kinase KdpD
MTADQRPDPDALLRLIDADERRAASIRGKLTVFFGAAPGVGKTYAMLEAARAEQRDGRDVLIGVIDTHGRFETTALLNGLPSLPPHKLLHRGLSLGEFDLDAAIARHPALILIDELAHTNAEGSRHPKRWQDIDELLRAGVDVFSTLNVQHVESLNDVVAKITGVIVRETVPDSVLEQASEIKLVDLPPDDLLVRLREGKVYVPAQADRALDHFFRKGNLIALRELALRFTAERVDAQMLAYRRAQGIEQTWPTADQLLVAVSPSPYSARLIRATRRMATALHAPFCAVYVQTPSAQGLGSAAQERLAQNLRLAQQLGAEVVTLAGDDMSEAILGFARARNITKIIVGKPVLARTFSRERWTGSLIDRLLRHSGDIDIYVTAGDVGPDERLPPADLRVRPRVDVLGYVSAVAMSALATLIALLVFGREQLADAVMVFLLGVVVVSARFSLGASIAAALVSVAAFDFVFIPPYLTFDIQDFRHGVTFFVMLLVAIVISTLTQRIRNQARFARAGEARTAALYALSRELSGARSAERVIEVAARQLERVFASQIAVFTPGPNDTLVRVYASAQLPAASEHEDSVSRWVWAQRREAGVGTDTLPGSQGLHLPLMASGGPVGVISVYPSRSEGFGDLELRRQLDTFTDQLAMALERARLAEETERTRTQVETERLRSALLSSVSHDLRTPLAVITGAASTLALNRLRADEHERIELAQTIFEEAERLNQLIRNLLDMTRLDSGAVTIKKDWVPLEEVVGAALNHLDSRLGEREVRVELAPELPLLAFDATLIELVFINLIENAWKYGQGPIEITATLAPREVLVEVADRGPGIPAGQEALIFEKFHRALPEHNARGSGLGLAICRAIVAAHGGRIWAYNRSEGGAALRFALPIEGSPPPLPAPEPEPS